MRSEALLHFKKKHNKHKQIMHNLENIWKWFNRQNHYMDIKQLQIADALCQIAASVAYGDAYFKQDITISATFRKKAIST